MIESFPFVPIERDAEEELGGGKRLGQLAEILNDIVFKLTGEITQGRVGASPLALGHGVVVGHDNEVVGEGREGGEVPEPGTGGRRGVEANCD